MTSIIEKRITLNPKYLTKNIKKHLIKQIEQETKNDCSKEYGYILKIKKLIDIKDNEDTSFLVKFEAETLKPEKDKILDGTVCKIYKDGIFVDIQQKQKILIPAMNIADFEFDEDNNKYFNENNEETIKENDTITVKISAVKYNKRKFSCFGSIA